MTEYVSRDNLKSLLASKMAVFNNAMTKIQRAETLSIFANMSQKTAEYRMFQFMSMVEEWEGVKSYSQLISGFIAEAQISAMLCQVHSFQAKVQSLQSISAEYKVQAKDEAFQLLDVGIDMMQDNLKTLDEQIAKCKDPAQLSILNKEKAQATESLKEAKRIKSIEDPDEAMKELYKFSQDSYKGFLKKTTSLTDEEIDAKLATCKPESDDVFGYFKATQGIWGLFKEGMQDFNNNLDAKKEQINSLQGQYSDLEKQKQDLIVQKEAIEKKETGIKQTETYFDAGKVISAGLSPILSPITTVGINLVEKYVLADDKEELSQSQQAFQQDQQKVQTSEAALNKQLNEIINPDGKVDPAEKSSDNKSSADLQEKIQSIEAQQQSIKVSTESIEAQQEQLTRISERIDKISNSEEFKALNQKVEDVSEKITDLQENNNLVKIKIREIRQQEKIDVEGKALEMKSAIKDGYASTLKTIQDSKQNASNLITSESLTMDELTPQINNVKNQLKESQQLSEFKRIEVEKEANQIKNQAAQSKNNDLLSKISHFIKSNGSNDTKVIIDQSLSDLYSDLSVNFGSDRVVIDKRGGDRRGGEDRRLEAKKANNTSKDTNNFFERKDASTRRTEDRRQNNHIFISQDTVNNWNFQS